MFLNATKYINERDFSAGRNELYYKIIQNNLFVKAIGNNFRY